MIQFSPQKQAFYDSDLSYMDAPDDLVDLDPEQHLALLDKINQGCRIFADLTYSDPAPSAYCVWDGAAWIDPRTADEKREAYLITLNPLTRRQFKLVLLEKNLLNQIEDAISAIADDQIRAKIQIEYTESTEFVRSSDSVRYMCQLLDLSDEQLDAMWEEAMTL